jgi:hydroxyacylglutathione hydrolase
MNIESYHNISVTTSRTSFALSAVVFLTMLCALIPAGAHAEITPGSMNVHWDEGAADCSKSTQPRLQVHPYNGRTFILRENLCATFEAPFLYLLVGSAKALLIDTGDIADPKQMPLAKTVLDLLPGDGAAKLPLLVVHTHRHYDHRLGDGQFAGLPNVQVVGFDIDSVRRFYQFTDWPNGLAQIDLGGRVVDAIPTPGHNETEVSFYDRDTGLFFSGDFLMPARLLIEDTSADLASAERAAAFLKDRQVSHVLGGHVEMDAEGKMFPWESQYHPHEHALELSKGDVLALPDMIRKFNGFYTVTGGFLLMNSIRILIVMAAGVGILLIALLVMIIRFMRRRRRRNVLQRN